MTWLLILLGLYVGICVLMFVFQGHLIFIGQHAAARALKPELVYRVERLELPAEVGNPGEQSFRIAQGANIASPKAVLLFFGGNGENLDSGLGWVVNWRDYDLEAVFVEYPGYDESDGHPSHATILAAADVAAGHAAKRARELGVPLFVGGSSLGTFSATHIAARRDDVARLLLLAPPTRLADAAAAQYPWLPVRWLIRHPFDSLAVADKVSCSTLIIHGDADSVVPQRMGRELAAAIGEDCAFVSVPGVGHVIPVARNGALGAQIAEFWAGRDAPASNRAGR